MAIYVDVISRLDERSAALAARQIDRQFTNAGKTAGQSMGRALESEASKAGKSAGASAGRALSSEIDRATSGANAGFLNKFSTHGVTAGRNFGSSFGSSMARSMPGVSGLSSAMAGYEGAASKAGALAGRALGVAFTTAAAGLIGAAGLTLFKGFERYKSLDATSKRLGAMGNSAEQVKSIMDDINKVVVGTPIALDAAAKSATQFLAGGVKEGKPLQAALTSIADAAGASGQRFEDLALIFNQVFNKGKLQAEEMMQLNERGINVQAALRGEFGLTADQLEKMSKDGQISFGMLVQAIEGQFGGMSQKMGDTVDGALSNMSTAVSKVGANFISAIFGDPLSTTDGPGALAESINNITGKLNELNAWIVSHKDDIKQAFDQGVEVAGDLLNVLGDIAKFLKEHPDLVKIAIGAYAGFKALTIGTGALAAVNTMLGTTLPASATSAATKISTALAAVQVPTWIAFLMKWGGPAMVGLQSDQKDSSEFGLPQVRTGPDGKLYFDESGVGDALSRARPNPDRIADHRGLAGGVGVGGGAALGIPGLPGATSDSGPLADLFPGATGSGGSGSGGAPKLPDAPVIPYDATVPGGSSPATFAAESSFLDARQKLAEKRARLDQLEGSNVASADDVQKARNDVIEAERDLQGAEIRLSEARQSAFEKQNKQLNKQATQLGEIGAQLDSDFGISKGLSGIAENITKFVANLAAAPLLGQLSAVSQANPTQGGHGLMGILGAQGAFGPQYQNNQYTNASAMGPAALQPAGMYPGDAALLANVPAGRYAQVQAADLTQGLGDCSSAVEDLVNIMDGRPTGGRSMATGNASEWLTSRGFVPGMGGPGDFRVGFNSGHMQATLPGGTNFNWGSDASAAQRGVDGGSGAYDPAFTSHYYRPAAPAAAPTYAPLTAAELTNPALTSPTPLAGVPSMGGGMLPGMGMPSAAPFANRQYGGIAPTSGSGKGGVGMSGGGALGMAVQAGGMALDAMAPGAGQAAQMGIKLANRAIEYGGQVAGIGAQGLMETFLPTGGSELANNNWITRIVGGLAGAAPALPNMAGKGSKAPEPPLDGSQVGGANSQQGQGQGSGLTQNVTVKEDPNRGAQGTGRDIADALQHQYSGPGM